ncbi:MAG: FMN-binding glutamate synthase family protein, partial [Xanthomonadales bacterium]|nr:FMN-binding glutamate synthase family protein [Xanthomonadales bacterium]
VATQQPSLYKGLVVADKKQRVANFHKATVESVVELIAAAGLESTDQLKRCHIQRRVNAEQVRCYDEIYPSMVSGCLLQEPYPEPFEKVVKSAHAEHF